MPISTALPTLVFMKLTDVQQHCLLIYYTTFLSNQSKDVESTDVGIYVTKWGMAFTAPNSQIWQLLKKLLWSYPVSNLLKNVENTGKFHVCSSVKVNVILPIFTAVTVLLWVYVETFCTEFHLDQSINMENIHINSFKPLLKVWVLLIQFLHNSRLPDNFL